MSEMIYHHSLRFIIQFIIQQDLWLIKFLLNFHENNN